MSRLYRGARYGSLGGGASETLRDLIGKKIVTDWQRGDGILGLGDDLGARHGLGARGVGRPTHNLRWTFGACC